MVFEEILADIAEAQAMAGEAMQHPASSDDLAALRAQLHRMFGARLPDAMAEVLGIANGVDFDGLVLYGAGRSPEAPGPGCFWQGIAAANALWRAGGGHHDRLILGETGMDLLTVATDGGRPAIRDRVSDDVVDDPGSAARRLMDALSARL